MIRAGKGIPGIVLFASWRLGWTLLLWFFVFILIVLLFKCLKSFLLSLADITQSLFDTPPDPCENPITVPPHGYAPPASNRRVGTIPRPSQQRAYDNLYARAPRATYAVINETGSTTPRPRPVFPNNNLNIPDSPPQYDQITPEEGVNPAPKPDEVEPPPSYESLYPAPAGPEPSPRTDRHGAKPGTEERDQ